MPAANLSDTEQQTLRDATKILKKMWEQGESSRKEIYDYLPFNLAILIGASAVSRTRPAELRKGAPRIVRNCQWCGHPFSAREMQQHVPKCPKKPL